MSRRAFVPEAPNCLEGRTLLSRSPGPVPLTASACGLNLSLIKGYFEQYATSGNLGRLRIQLSARADQVPSAGLTAWESRSTRSSRGWRRTSPRRFQGQSRRPTIRLSPVFTQVVAGDHSVVASHIRGGTVVILK